MESPTATITYDVPEFVRAEPELPRYGEHEGTVLLHLILKADGPGLTAFLAQFAAENNAAARAEDRRADISQRMLDIITKALVPNTRLTGFKAHKNLDPKTRYAKPTIPNEGEGCQSGYCGLAAKYRLPDPPESLTWANWTLVCQKHAVSCLEAQAQEMVNPKGQFRIYLSSAHDRMIKDVTRDALKTVKA